MITDQHWLAATERSNGVAEAAAGAGLRPRDLSPACCHYPELGPELGHALSVS
jgi:hypothetical protein